MSRDFDLILRGGHLIDPKNQLDGPKDVVIRAGRVAAVGDGITADNAKTIDISRL